MAEGPSSCRTDEEKCLEHIAETNCVEILKKVIEYKVGTTPCSLFCKEISEKCKTFSADQRRLLRQGIISDFDSTLCAKVIRNIEGIKPDKEKWNSKIADNDHSLFAALKRIFRFQKEVIYSPDDAELSPEELFCLISTAFKDIQSEFRFERDLSAELNSIRVARTADRPPVNRLSSQVVTDAIIESKDSELQEEIITDSDIDLETEYSFLQRFAPGERVTAKSKIRLIQKYKDRFPADLKAPQSDVMVVYSEDDRCPAETFRQTIDGRILVLENGRRVQVKAILYDDKRFEGTELGSVEKAYERSTYAFLYLTKTFVENDYNKLVAESLLMDSINNKEKKWRVVPFHTSLVKNRQYKVPLGINSLKSENVCQQDEFYWIRLLGNKIHEREDREFALFEKEYQKALEIQRDDENRVRASMGFDRLNLQDTESQRNLPVEVVRPLQRPDDSESASIDERKMAQAPSY